MREEFHAVNFELRLGGSASPPKNLAKKAPSYQYFSNKEKTCFNALLRWTRCTR